MRLLVEAKKALKIPVIASICCQTLEEWIDYAQRFVNCKADAIELNYYPIASDASVEGKEVDKMLAEHAFYSRTAIPGGMYQGNAQNIPTFVVKATLVTTSATDDETVYQLTKAVFDNFDSFKTLHFVF